MPMRRELPFGSYSTVILITCLQFSTVIELDPGPEDNKSRDRAIKKKMFQCLQAGYKNQS